MEDKICTKCNIKKNIDQFNLTGFILKNGESQRRSQCKQCDITYKKEYNIKNKEKIKVKKCKYYENNKKEILEKRKEYNKDKKDKKAEYDKKRRRKKGDILRALARDRYHNVPGIKESIIKRSAIYNKIKYNNDINFKLHSRISSEIRKWLKRNDISKNGNSILNLLPYTIEKLKAHIESKFEWWMTWDNWGVYDAKTWKDDDSTTWTWQLDHIIPKSFFICTSIKDKNVRQCWALNNLRPYSSKLNIIDGNRR